MKTIRIRYNQLGDISGIDVSEGIELGDIVELQCKGKTFLVHIVKWGIGEAACNSCALRCERCLNGTLGICSRILTGRRVCFQDMCTMLEDL